MDTMLSRALREFTTGPLHQLLVNLGGQNGAEWEEELKKFLRKEPCWANGQVAQVIQPKPTPLIIELVSTVVVPATTSKFVAKDKFVVNTRCHTKVLISKFWEDFTEWFLLGDGKIEDPVGEQTLHRRKSLWWSLVNGQIITELGGEVKAETTLSEMFSLMEKQKNGEDGVLLTNNRANIFYIRDQSGVLRTVFVYWVCGWYVGAGPIGHPRGWEDGSQVFSRV